MEKKDCQHDWMAMGSREVCVRCDQARMRKDLPAWEFDKKSRTVVKTSKRENK